MAGVPGALKAAKQPLAVIGGAKEKLPLAPRANFAVLNGNNNNHNANVPRPSGKVVSLPDSTVICLCCCCWFRRILMQLPFFILFFFINNGGGILDWPRERERERRECVVVVVFSPFSRYPTPFC